MSGIAVYSSQLIVVAGLTSSATFTVPAGYRCVVRDADVYNDTNTQDILYMEGSAGQTIWFATTNLTSPSYNSWRGRQVLGPGDVLTCRSGSGSAFDVSVSGYLLTLP